MPWPQIFALLNIMFIITHTHTRARTHTYTHTRTHAHTHTRTHAHTHIEYSEYSEYSENQSLVLLLWSYVLYIII